MDIQPWHIWIIIGILAFIIEVFTPSFIAGSVGIGLFAGGIAAALNASTEIQLLVFSLFVLISFLTIRPLMLRWEAKKRLSHTVKTNAESLVGKKGKVTETIDNVHNTGRIALDGDSWQARSHDGSIIEIGTIAEVLELDSIVLIVRN